MAWIKVFSEIWDSWKTPTLCEALKISEVQAIGHLISLWTFTERNAWRDGDLKKWGCVGIAKAGRWTGDPNEFISALQKSEFMDAKTFKIHEWEKHQSGMIHDRSRRLPGISRGYSGDFAGQIREEKIREEKKKRAEDKKISNNKNTEGRTLNPTLAEVQKYCKTIGIPIDPVRFWSHYQALNWKVGSAPIIDWKALCMKWTTTPILALQQTFTPVPKVHKIVCKTSVVPEKEDPKGWEPLK